MDEGLQRRTLPHQNDLVWHPNIGKIFCEIGPMTTIEAHALIVWFYGSFGGPYLSPETSKRGPRNEDIRHKWHRLLKPPRLAGGCLALHSFVKNNCRRTPFHIKTSLSASHLTQSTRPRRRETSGWYYVSWPNIIWPNNSLPTTVGQS